MCVKRCLFANPITAINWFGVHETEFDGIGLACLHNNEVTSIHFFALENFAKISSYQNHTLWLFMVHHGNIISIHFSASSLLKMYIEKNCVTINSPYQPKTDTIYIHVHGELVYILDLYYSITCR